MFVVKVILALGLVLLNIFMIVYLKRMVNKKSFIPFFIVYVSYMVLAILIWIFIL